MTLQQKKSKKFGEALESFKRYRTWNERLFKEGKITKEELERRVSKRAEILDL